MKKLLLVLVLLISSVAYANVVEQQASNNVGQTFIRFINQSDSYVACYYRDNYNYFTFSIPPYSPSPWYPAYGVYQWECRYY